MAPREDNGGQNDESGEEETEWEPPDDDDIEGGGPRGVLRRAALIEVLADHFYGSKSAAGYALDAVLDTIARELARGERVVITGFGTFEKRIRDARWVQNPQTGERMKTRKTAVPKFSPGTDLREVVSGVREPSGLTAVAHDYEANHDLASIATYKVEVRTRSSSSASRRSAAKASTTRKSASKKAAASRSAVKKTAAKKSPAKKSVAKNAAAKKSVAKKTAAKKSPAKRAAKKS